MASPRARSRSLTRPQPPRSTHVPPLPSSDFGDTADANGHGSESSDYAHARRHRADSGGESEPESDSEFHTHSNPSSLTLTINSPFEALKTRLLPLKHVEALLIAKLVPPNEEEATHLAGPSHSNNPQGSGSNSPTGNSYRNQEVFVRPGAGWKGALSRARVSYPSFDGSDDGDESQGIQRPTSAGNTGLETPDEPQEIINSCRKDMMQLWNDDGVREILKKRKIRLEESSGL